MCADSVDEAGEFGASTGAVGTRAIVEAMESTAAMPKRCSSALRVDYLRQRRPLLERIESAAENQNDRANPLYQDATQFLARANRRFPCELNRIRPLICGGKYPVYLLPRFETAIVRVELTMRPDRYGDEGHLRSPVEPGSRLRGWYRLVVKPRLSSRRRYAGHSSVG